MKLRSNKTFYAPTTEDWARNRKTIAIIRGGEDYRETLNDGSFNDCCVFDNPVILSMRDFVGYVIYESKHKYLMFETEEITYEVSYESLDFYKQKQIKLINKQ